MLFGYWEMLSRHARLDGVHSLKSTLGVSLVITQYDRFHNAA